MSLLSARSLDAQTPRSPAGRTPRAVASGRRARRSSPSPTPPPPASRRPAISRSAGTTTTSRPRPAPSSLSSSSSKRKTARADAALLYVRAARSRGADAGDSRDRGRGRRPPPPPASYPLEEIYPVTLVPGQPVRIVRGCSLSPGKYELTVVVRERERQDARGRRRAAAVLRQTLDVPDFSTNELTTSTVMLADALTVLPGRPGEHELSERPYVIGNREIEPAADARFRPSEELIVVFLVYNPAVTPAKHFDLEVEYHFFKTSRAGEEGPGPSAPTGVAALPGERYFNRTEPQRFNPVTLGPRFRPCRRAAGAGRAGRPVGRISRGRVPAVRQGHGPGGRAIPRTSRGVYCSAVMCSPACIDVHAARSTVSEWRQLPWNA